MTSKNIRRLLLYGVLLGTAPILVSRLPFVVMHYSGLKALGTNTLYMLVAMAIAWVYRASWRKSFVASYGVIFVAFATFYSVSTLMYRLFFVIPTTRFPIASLPPMPLLSFLLFMSWVVIALPACALFGVIMSSQCLHCSPVRTFMTLMSLYFLTLLLAFFEVGRSLLSAIDGVRGGSFGHWRLAETAALNFALFLTVSVVFVAIIRSGIRLSDKHNR